jgi:pimeloyl-ACP methyl ester carboxylesterase
MRFVLTWLPSLGRAMFTRMAARARRVPLGFVPQGCGPADVRALERPGVRDRYVAALLEAYRAGVEGVIEDQRLQLLDWEIDLRAIATPIHVWHGAADRVVPPSVARRVAAALPNATLTVLPDAGHFSSVTEHAAEIIADLEQTVEHGEH